MACFLVPAAQAAVVTVVEKKVAAKDESAGRTRTRGGRISWARKLQWLTNMLWGGSLLLLFEHVWHGEVVPWFPFLTASADPADTAAMLREMSTVGVGMALLVTAIWGVMVIVAERIAARGAAAAA